MDNLEEKERWDCVCVKVELDSSVCGILGQWK